MFTVPAGALLGRLQNGVRHLHSCTLARLLGLSRSLFPLGGLQTKLKYDILYITQLSIHQEISELGLRLG